jgi:hypothetical protein
MKETILKKDSDWSAIEGDACKITNFSPSVSVQNGKVLTSNSTEPYASIIFECTKIPGTIKGFIFHKLDFQHLWEATKERGISDNEELIIFYNKKYLKTYAKLFSAFMPRFWITICPKGAFELMKNPNYRPDLQGEARFLAKAPIVDWKPNVMN